ncbi:MAG: outer membrane usher protein [Paraglaciecola sp.]
MNSSLKANKFLVKLYVALIFSLTIFQLKAVEEFLEVKSAQTTISPKTVNLPQILFLTIEVNARVISGVFYAEKFIDGRLILVEDAWTASNLNLPGAKVAMDYGQFGYDLRSLKGANYDLNISSQAINITAPSYSFGITDLTNKVNSDDLTNTSPLGLYVNYDLTSTTTTSNEGANSFGAVLEGIVFNHYGSLVTSMFHHASSSIASDQSRTIRAETYFQKDLPSNTETVILGDAVSSSGSWSRPVRFGGIIWSTDFSLKSGFISAAAPSINGSAALPSTIDILINNQKSQSDSVNAGPFQISDFPTVSGAGQINIVVKDILGIETIKSQSFYSTPRLLRTNLNEFSIEAGMERKKYGLESNVYEKPFIAGTFRRGFDGFTIEGRTELQASRQAAGIEVAGLIKKYAVMYFALAVSKTEMKKGLQTIFGIERSSKEVNVNLKVEHYDRDFLQMGASASEINPRQKILVGLGLNIYRNLWINTNVISQTNWNSEEFNLISANLSIPLIGNIRLNTYANKQFGKNQDYTVGLNIVIPFMNGKNMVLTSTHDTQGKIYSNVQLNKTIVNSNGIGYRVLASDSASQRALVSINVNTPINKITLDADPSALGKSFRLRTSGSVGMLGGLLFASKKIGHGSFAVIKVADEPNIDVYQSNHIISSTNSSGLAFLPNVLPYQKNKISIRPEDLPFDLEVNETSQLITPYARSGVFVSLDIKKTNNRLVKLLKADGSPMPIGSKVHMLLSNTDFVVGRRGEVYLMGLHKNNSTLVSYQDGTCSANISAPINSTERNTMLIVACK